MLENPCRAVTCAGHRGTKGKGNVWPAAWLVFSLNAVHDFAGQLNGGNNVLNPYVNGNVNASSVAQQLVSGASAAGQLARYQP